MFKYSPEKIREHQIMQITSIRGKIYARKMRHSNKMKSIIRQKRGSNIPRSTSIVIVLFILIEFVASKNDTNRNHIVNAVSEDPTYNLTQATRPTIARKYYRI